MASVRIGVDEELVQELDLVWARSLLVAVHHAVLPPQWTHVLEPFRRQYATAEDPLIPAQESDAGAFGIEVLWHPWQRFPLTGTAGTG
jgi:hypothetical protein